MCATSLPMSIPTFSHHPRASIVEDEDEELVSEVYCITQLTLNSMLLQYYFNSYSVAS